MTKKATYDGKKLFEAYCGWGAAATDSKLREYAQSVYHTSSQMGATYAMWRWAFKESPEEAYLLYKEYWKDKEFNERPQDPPSTWELSWEQFLEILKRKAQTPSIGGSPRKRLVERFCAKYGLPIDLHVNPEEVVQVVRRDNPLYQSLWIVDRVEDKNSVYVFGINNEGICIEEKFRVRDIGVVGKAIQSRKQSMQIKNMSILPRLESVAEENGHYLTNIDFRAKDGIDRGYRFWYAMKKDDEWKNYSYFYTDFDEGVDKEIERFKTLLQQPEPVV